MNKTSGTSEGEGSKTGPMLGFCVVCNQLNKLPESIMPTGLQPGWDWEEHLYDYHER